MAKKANGEGSVYKRKSDGLYIASITLEGKRKTFAFKKKADAYAKLREVQQNIQQGTFVERSQQTLEQFLMHWLEYTVKHTLRARSYERYEEIARLHIIPRLGNVKLQDLKPQHIQVLQAEKLEEGLSASTVGIIHQVLHKSLDDAVKLGLLGKNVCKAVPPPRENRKEVKPLTPDQSRKLLEVAKGHPLEALFVLALTTGMRRGELFALKWSDIDLEHGVLYVRRTLSRVPTKVRGESQDVLVEAETKTQRSRRSIVLTLLAVEALIEHRVKQDEQRRIAGASWQDNDYVFCAHDGTYLSPNHVSSVHLKRLLKEAGLPDIRFHDLRHGAATLLLSLQVHPKVVQEILGHSDISTTMNIYSHVLPSMQADAMKQLHSAFKQEDLDKGK